MIYAQSDVTGGSKSFYNIISILPALRIKFPNFSFQICHVKRKINPSYISFPMGPILVQDFTKGQDIE